MTEQFTEADVLLVGAALGGDQPLAAHYEDSARAILSALAEAGRLVPDGAEHGAAAAALRDVNRRLAAAHYMSMGGLPWVGREAMFAAVNESAKAVLGEQWVALMRDERPTPATTCPVCSAPDCHCAMCSMIASGDVPASLAKPHAATCRPRVEGDEDGAP